MFEKSLKDIICEHIVLSEIKSNGWCPVRCMVCNDHVKKGLRGGFRFENDIVSYKCFNCNHTALFDPSEHKKFSRKMLSVFTAFGIPVEECNAVLIKNYDSDKSKKIDRKIQNYDPLYIDLPKDFYRITDDTNSVFDQLAKAYLSHRYVDYNLYPFYMSEDTRWRGRVIIPMYKNNKLIFYTARDLLGNKKTKYLSVDIPKENVLFGYEQLFTNFHRPLFVMEGFFDAFVVEGCALLGNTMTEGQIYHLNKSPRTKVYIPDMYGDGDANALKALSLGWKISIPDIGKCKDINESFIQYGKIYTLKSIVENTMDGFKAELFIKNFSKNSKKPKR